ncbi:MAG: glycosyltransferase family 4 protein [Sphingomonadaceae bacterium]|nr:glycosyltransferase family 4 protein [Sphingomonadaceae bacterium]
MRVCFISRRYFPAISGMSIYAQNLLRELAAAGHDVTMISQYYGEPRFRSVYGGGPPPEVPGVRVIGLEALGEQDGGKFEADIERIAETIAAEHAAAPFDVLHAQYGYPTGWAALVAGARLGLPVVVSIQGGDGHWVGSCCETHRTAMVRVIEQANAVLIGGSSFRAEVVERLGVAPRCFTLVPGAVDTRRFHPRAGEREPGPLRLLYHGRVDRRKGVLDFLDALAAIDPLRDGTSRPPRAGEGDHEQHDGRVGARQPLHDEDQAARSASRCGGVEGWTAIISGIGPDVDSARERIAALQLGGRVAMTGYADYAAAPAIYRAHDVFVSPTYAEGFSNTVLEAMASGLPVVSCDTVGVSDCLRDGDNALLATPGDVPALAAALRRLLAEPQLRERLASTALAECRRTYSWSAVGALIVGVYASVRGGKPGAAFDPHLPVTPCRFRAEPHLL